MMESSPKSHSEPRRPTQEAFSPKRGVSHSDIVLRGLKRAVEDGKLSQEDFDTYSAAYEQGLLGKPVDE